MSEQVVHRFVLGFVYYEGQVLLIQKNRPAWQAGKWNGIGGKIEPNETLLGAMSREGVEEAALAVPWKYRGLMHGANTDGTPFECHLFTSRPDTLEFMQCEDELVMLHSVSSVQDLDCIANVPGLVHLLGAEDNTRIGITYE